MGRGEKDEVQICSRDESCHSDAVHGICMLINPRSDVCVENLTVMSLEPNTIRPSFGSLSVGLRLMNWKSCGVLNMI